MTDNTNIIKEALEPLREFVGQQISDLAAEAQEGGPANRVMNELKKWENIRYALALIDKGEVMWSGTSEEGVTSYYPQDFAAEYIERTTGVKMTKVLVIPLKEKSE